MLCGLPLTGTLNLVFPHTKRKKKMATTSLPRPDAGVTSTGNFYILDGDGFITWICGCGNEADGSHTFFDTATEQYVTRRNCGDCRQNLP